MASLKELLKSAADDYSESLLELDGSVSEKHFKRGSFFGETPTQNENPFKLVRDAAIKVGTVLEEDEPSGLVKVMLRGGAANMAPVLVIVTVEKGKVRIGAYSREGLIPQHAAEKAVGYFIKYLK